MYYPTDAERLATLEQENREFRANIAEMKGDIKSILGTLAAMSGGRKALLGLFMMVGTFLGGIVSLVAAIVSGFVHR
jgi:hypothetical protein